MLKILHLADLHLDSRFAELDATEARKKRAQLREIFKNALELAKKENCAATLICGDLFDGEYYTSDTLSFLSECFKRMPEHHFFITPGNHDPHGPASPYRFADFPENVHVFSSEQITCITLDDIRLNVYGYAFIGQIYEKNPLADFIGVKDNGYFNLLCAHTELDATTQRCAPIPKSSLGAFGFDYAALGHIHTDDEIYKSGDTVFAYSGCIAGRDFGEHGKRGGILLTLDEKNGKKSVAIKKIRFCPWIYETVSVSIEGVSNMEEALKIISEKLPDCLSEKAEYIVRLRLTGAIEFEIDTLMLLNELSKYGVKSIKNDTSALLCASDLENDFSIRGAFYRALKQQLGSENEQERKTAELALKYGLTALGRGEIDV